MSRTALVRVVGAVGVLGALTAPLAAQSPPIEDNSFLIEEAYNQEPHVVQHIGTWLRALRSAPWIFTFTQEWPLWSQRHQFSYSIPFQSGPSPQRSSGCGEAARVLLVVGTSGT